MKVFIVGANRSGKTTLVNILKGLCQGVRDEEEETYYELLRLAMQYYHDRKDVTGPLSRLLPKDFSVSANPAYFSLVPQLASLYPDAKYVFLCRNGMDQIAEFMNGNLYTSRDRYRRLRFRQPLLRRRFDRCCVYWTLMNSELLAGLEGRNFLRVQFENLFAAETVEGVLDFIRPGQMLPLDFRPDRAAPRAPMLYSQREKQTFQRLCGATMARLGYASPAGER